MKSIIIVATIALLAIRYTDAQNATSIGFNETAITAGPSTLTIIVNVTDAEPDRNISVQCTSMDGTAKEGVDYKRLNEPITFSQGSNMSQKVSVEILSNATKGRMFSLMLTTDDTVTLSTSTLTITIAVSVGFTRTEIEVSPGNTIVEAEVNVIGNIVEGDMTTIQLASQNETTLANSEIELVRNETHPLTATVNISKSAIGNILFLDIIPPTHGENVTIFNGTLTIKVVHEGQSTQSPLGPGAIAGIAVGSVVILILIVASILILVVVVKKKEKK